MPSIPHRSPQHETRSAGQRSARAHWAGGGWQFLDRTLGDDLRFRRLVLLVLLITALATHPNATETVIRHTLTGPTSTAPCSSTSVSAEGAFGRAEPGAHAHPDHQEPERAVHGR